jgi:nicotinate-nucleotide pyrophosphorylase (carboxylating)
MHTPHMSKLFLDAKHLIRAGLRDDGWPSDWTTLGSVKNPLKKVRARLVAKASGIWAGAALTHSLNSVARELAEITTGDFLAQSRLEDGEAVKPGQQVAEWTGSAILVLALERPFLNLAQFAGGIATATHEFAAIVKKACPKATPRVTATRKTLPYYRDLAFYALQVGGGHVHRTNLAGGVLIKENHIAAAGGIAQAIRGTRSIAPHGFKIEIEVRDLQELQKAIKAHADVIMLDNFSVADVQRAIKMIDASFPPGSSARPLIVVSGGLSTSNIAKYAIPGVDILSIGSLTHSVRALDISLLVE